MTLDLNIDWQAFLLDILVTSVGAAAILLIGHWLAGLSRRFLHRILVRARMTPAVADLIERVVYYSILVIAIAWTLVVLGIPAELVALAIAAVLVAAVLALRESLSDIAATVLFVLFQPFKPGDFIETNGVSGRVQEVLLLNTLLVMSDNRLLTIPNRNIQNSNLINYSVKEHLRLDVPLTVSYSDDLGRVRDTLLGLAKEDSRVLGTPAPTAAVVGLADHGVQMVLRVHVKPDDYAELQPLLTERIKVEFDRRSITFAVPQLELRLHKLIQANRETNGAA